MSTFRDLGQRIGTVGLGAIAILALVGVTLAFYLGYYNSLTREHGRTIHAVFSDARQLQVADDVMVDGQKSGRVDHIESLPGNRGAVVTMELFKNAGDVHADARASIRWRLLLGGAFYVGIDHGSPSAPKLATGGTIPRANTNVQVELDDISHLVQGGSGRGLQTMPGELAQTLQNPSQPAGALRAVTKGAPSLRDGLKALRGQDRDTDLTGLVKGAAATVRNLDQPNDDLRTLLGGAASTLQTISARNQQLRQTLGVAPQTMTALHTTLARLAPTLTNADDLVNRLRKSAGDVAPTLSDLHPTLNQTGTLLRSARPLLTSLRPAVRSVASSASDGVPLIDELRPSLERADDTIIPYLGRKDPGTGKSTTVMIGGTAAGFGGSAGQQDSNGHFIRFAFSLGSHNAYLPCSSSLIDPTSAQLASCDSLQTALSTYLKYLPGAPNQGGNPGDGAK